jgi:hypothetical protein
VSAAGAFGSRNPKPPPDSSTRSSIPLPASRAAVLVIVARAIPVPEAISPAVTPGRFPTTATIAPRSAPGAARRPPRPRRRRTSGRPRSPACHPPPARPTPARPADSPQPPHATPSCARESPQESGSTDHRPSSILPHKRVSAASARRAWITERLSAPLPRVLQSRGSASGVRSVPAGTSTVAIRPTQQRAGAPRGASGLLLCQEAEVSLLTTARIVALATARDPATKAAAAADASARQRASDERASPDRADGT